MDQKFHLQLITCERLFAETLNSVLTKNVLENKMPDILLAMDKIMIEKVRLSSLGSLEI